MKIDLKAGTGVVAVAVLLSAWPARGQEPSPSPSPVPEATPPAPAPSPSVPPAVRETWLRRVAANDKRRTMRSYPANLAYNALGVLTKGNRRNLGAAVVLAVSQRAALEPGQDQIAPRADDVFDHPDDVSLEFLDPSAVEHGTADADHPGADFRDTHLRRLGARRGKPEDRDAQDDEEPFSVHGLIPL